MAIENLWGELPEPTQVRTPKALLREQATILTEQTNRMLMGQVRTSSDRVKLIHELYIVAPNLGSYEIAIIRIWHSAALFPVHVYDLLAERNPILNLPNVRMNPYGQIEVLSNADRICDTMVEFERAVKSILQSDPVRSVIASLLAQIQE